MPKPFFAAVRCARIRSVNQLRRIEQHGKRLDPDTQHRVEPSRTKDTLATSAYCPDAPLNLVDAFKARKAAVGASERAGAAIGLHVLAIVSPEWVDTGGDRHNPRQPRNFTTFCLAKDWAEETFGKGSLIAARMDMDEAGAGVVDLFVVPVSEQKQRQGKRQRDAGLVPKTKPVISVRDALMKIQERHKRARSYEALQDSWAACAQQHLDPNFQRGVPKSEAARQHVHADVYRAEIETARARADEQKTQAFEQAGARVRSAREQAATMIKEVTEYASDEKARLEAQVATEREQATAAITASRERVRVSRENEQKETLHLLDAVTGILDGAPEDQNVRSLKEHFRNYPPAYKFLELVDEMRTKNLEWTTARVNEMRQALITPATPKQIIEMAGRTLSADSKLALGALFGKLDRDLSIPKSELDAIKANSARSLMEHEAKEGPLVLTKEQRASYEAPKQPQPQPEKPTPSREIER